MFSQYSRLFLWNGSEYGLLALSDLDTTDITDRCSNPVLAVAVPNDVYLTYSIFILTSAWRICSFPLDIGSEPHHSYAQDAFAAGDNSPGRFLTPADGPPAHVSLLTEEPFKPPTILSRHSGLPSNPRLAIGPPSAKEEFKLTPDSLRYLGKVVTNLTNQIHEILVANRAVTLRNDLQKKEFQLQQGRCGEMMDAIDQLNDRYVNMTKRAQRIRESQKALSARQDRILQTLVQQASPELSEHEKKWFDELKRMKEEVVGAGRYDEGSLAARARLVSGLGRLSVPLFLTVIYNSSNESTTDCCQSYKTSRNRRLSVEKNTLTTGKALGSRRHLSLGRSRIRSTYFIFQEKFYD